MSKASKPRDRWSQVHSAANDRPAEFCKGCGYFAVTQGHHRADCTAPPVDEINEREGA